MDIKRFLVSGVGSQAIIATLGLSVWGAPAVATTFYYDPATGTVALDTATSPTGKLTTYELAISGAGDVRFRSENHVRLSSSPWYMSNAGIISDRSNADGLSGYFTIGEVLPAGLDESTWASLFPTPPEIKWDNKEPKAPREPRPAVTPQPFTPTFTETDWSWLRPDLVPPPAPPPTNPWLDPDTSSWWNNVWQTPVARVEPARDLIRFNDLMVSGVSYIDSRYAVNSDRGKATIDPIFRLINPDSVTTSARDNPYRQPGEILPDTSIIDTVQIPASSTSSLDGFGVPSYQDPHVYTSDIASTPAFQHGPATFTYGLPDREFDNWADLLDPETLTWAQSAELHYDPATGGVTLDTTGADAGYMSGLALESPFAFWPEGFVSPVDRAVISTANAEMVVVITDLIAPGVYDLGTILDAGLALETVESLLSESSFTTRARTESGRFTQTLAGVGFRVVAVPEPTTAALLFYLTIVIINFRPRTP